MDKSKKIDFFRPADDLLFGISGMIEQAVIRIFRTSDRRQIAVNLLILLSILEINCVPFGKSAARDWIHFGELLSGTVTFKMNQG